MRTRDHDFDEYAEFCNSRAYKVVVPIEPGAETKRVQAQTNEEWIQEYENGTT